MLRVRAYVTNGRCEPVNYEEQAPFSGPVSCCRVKVIFKNRFINTLKKTFSN